MAAKTKPHILILGAGLSGLSTGHLLKKQGYKVTILEARDRVGGRIHTKLIDSKEQLTVEMGAEWIGGKHQRVLKLCKELGLTLFDHKLETHLLYNNKYFPPRKWNFSQKWEDKLHKILKKLPNFKKEDLENLEGIDLWHFLVANHVPKRDVELIDLLDSLDYGESIHFIPTLDALYSSLDKDSKESTDFFAISGGSDQLPKALVKRIGAANIHLSCLAQVISQSSNGIKVISSGGRVFAGDYLICTLPGFSFSQIRWEPELERGKQRAVDQLMYSRIIKTHLLFDNRFWKDENFEILTDQLPHEIYHATQNQPGVKGVLSSYATGDKAHALSNMSAQQKQEEILRVLTLVFGKIDANILKNYSYYWGDDPFTGGAFALYEEHHSSEFKEILSKPQGRVFFAGEHLADTYQGFMEGAVESGENAVQSLLDKLPSGLRE